MELKIVKQIKKNDSESYTSETETIHLDKDVLKLDGYNMCLKFNEMIDKAIKALSLALFQLESLDIPKRQIKYNDKLIIKLITYIKDKLDTIKQSSLVLFKHYEKYLYSLNLGLLLA